MTLKKSALFGVLLASTLIGQQAHAQSTPVKAAPAFVPMPRDIQCELRGMSFRSVVGANAQLTETSGSIDGVTCWITGKTPEQKKEIPLVSTEIVRGLLNTRDFGKLKITPTNSITSSGVGIAIRGDKLQSFRALLQKSENVKTAIQSPAPIYSGLIATSNVERGDPRTLPADFEKGSLVFSEDGKHSAFVSELNGSRRIVLDGIPGQEFRRCCTPTFSRAGKLFYWAMSNGSITLSADGKLIPTSLAGEGSIVISNNGTHWAAFGAERATQSGNQVTSGAIVVYVDGVEFGKYRDISYPDFSQDGKHFAFISSDSGQMNLVVDGSVTTRFGQPNPKSSFHVNLFVNGPNMFMEASVHYISGGGIVALAHDTIGWTVYKEGQVLRSYAQNVLGGEGYQIMGFSGFDDAASIQARSLVVAENAPVAAWWERPSGKGALWRVVVNGKPADSVESPNFWSSKPPVLSRDGKHIAYAAIPAPGDSKGPSAYVIIDGVKQGPYSNIWGIRFTDDGKHLAYAVSDGTDGDAWTYLLDGKPFGKKVGSVHPPVFSANGRHIAWQAERDKKPVLIVDGEEIATTEEVVWGPQVLDSGVTSWAVREGTKVIRINTSIK